MGKSSSPQKYTFFKGKKNVDVSTTIESAKKCE